AAPELVAAPAEDDGVETEGEDPRDQQLARAAVQEPAHQLMQIHGGSGEHMTPWPRTGPEAVKTRSRARPPPLWGGLGWGPLELAGEVGETSRAARDDPLPLGEGIGVGRESQRLGT